MAPSSGRSDGPTPRRVMGPTPTPRRKVQSHFHSKSKRRSKLTKKPQPILHRVGSVGLAVVSWPSMVAVGRLFLGGRAGGVGRRDEFYEPIEE